MDNNHSIYASPLPLRQQHRSLIWELTKRDVFGRYRGATLGVVWSILNPFLMLAVYTLAFGEILRARWPGTNSPGDFAFIIFVGLMVHAFFAECVTRAPALISSNANYVKKVVFPLEVMPWPVVMSGLFHAAMNAIVLLVAMWLIKGHVPATAILLPLVMLPLVPILLGAVWVLSAIGTYLRDVSQLMPPLATAMLFLSSAIVPVDTLSEKYRVLFRANPLTIIIDEARSVVLYGQLPNWVALSSYMLFACIFALAGYCLFRRLRKGFADVL